MIEEDQCPAHTRTPWGTSAHIWPACLRNFAMAGLLLCFVAVLVLVIIFVIGHHTFWSTNDDYKLADPVPEVGVVGAAYDPWPTVVLSNGVIERGLEEEPAVTVLGGSLSPSEDFNSQVDQTCSHFQDPIAPLLSGITNLPREQAQVAQEIDNNRILLTSKDSNPFTLAMSALHHSFYTEGTSEHHNPPTLTDFTTQPTVTNTEISYPDTGIDTYGISSGLAGLMVVLYWAVVQF